MIYVFSDSTKISICDLSYQSRVVSLYDLFVLFSSTILYLQPFWIQLTSLLFAEGETTFEKEVLPNSKFSTEEMKKRTGTIKDWLNKRQLKFQERDRMRKFTMTLTKKDSMSLDDMVKAYLKKKKTQEYTFEELREIYNMTDNKDLSTNDLLRLFRKEVPAVEG